MLIDNRQDAIQVDEALEAFAVQVVEKVLALEACEEEYEVSLSFVGNEEIRSLNETYRGIDSPTDVLSFPMLEFEDEDALSEALQDQEEVEYIDEELALGDIVVSLEKAKEQAEEYGHSFERELAFLLTHGMLHLLGYDHGDEASEKMMFEKQEDYLRQMKINR